MTLYINGKKAEKGMEIIMDDGTAATLVFWAGPGERSGGNGGRVYVRRAGDNHDSEYFPHVIGGEFRNE